MEFNKIFLTLLFVGFVGSNVFYIKPAALPPEDQSDRKRPHEDGNAKEATEPAAKKPRIDNKPGWTDLHTAAYNGDIALVKQILGKNHSPEFINATVNNPDDQDHGRAALHIATAYGHLEIVNFLITECKVDPNSIRNYPGHPTHGAKAIHIAASYEYLNIIKFLINERHVDPNSAINNPGQSSHGTTALHIAACTGQFEVIKFLINECHVDPNSAINNPGHASHGNTALHLAADHGQFEVIKFLINECHVDPNSTINNPGHASHGETALHIAAYYGHSEGVKCLIAECNVDPNTKINNPGFEYHDYTALHFAAAEGHTQTVECLLTLGTNPRLKEITNKTAYDLAFENDHTEIGKIIMLAAALPVSECPICTCDINVDDKIVVFHDCMHVICGNVECLITLTKCPICRTQRDFAKDKVLVVSQDFVERAKKEDALPK